MSHTVEGVRPPIDAAALRAAAAPRWARIDVEDEVGSTNAVLAADPHAPAGSVLVAEHQTSGRGRLTRTWSSPPRAGLTFSVLLRPTVAGTRWGWLPLLTGIAVRAAVADVAGVPAVLKWPNDLLAAADGRKLAGILAQSTGAAVVIGLGLNVTTTTAELRGTGGTSLALCGATNTDRTALLGAVLHRLDSWLTRWEAAHGDPAASGVEAAYRTASATLGIPVRVTGVDGRTLTGRAVDLDADGRLVVATSDGRRAVSAGDVEHVRPG
jgi:BirA family biotin operon repressor/biotin-[acetyl-CoA-carboxylase] ligase